MRVPPLTLGEHVLTFRASADDGGVATSHAFDVTNDGLIAAVVAEPEAEGGTLFVDIDSLAPAGSLVFDAHAGGRPLEVDARSGRVAIDPWAFSAGPLALEIAALVDGALASALTTTVQIPRLAPALEVALDDPQRPTALLATGRVQGAASTLVVSLDGAELARTVAGEVRVPIDRGGEATVQLADAAGEVVATRSVAVPAASTGGRSWPVPAALGTVAVAAAYGVLVLWRRRPPASVSAAPAPVRAALEARLAGPSHARATRPAGARRQRIALVVYPFDSFAAVARFQTALRRLSGIVDARLTSFEARTLHLTVDYEDVVPLAERLERSTGFSSPRRHPVSRGDRGAADLSGGLDEGAASRRPRAGRRPRATPGYLTGSAGARPRSAATFYWALAALDVRVGRAPPAASALRRWRDTVPHAGVSLDRAGELRGLPPARPIATTGVLAHAAMRWPRSPAALDRCAARGAAHGLRGSSERGAGAAPPPRSRTRLRAADRRRRRAGGAGGALVWHRGRARGRRGARPAEPRAAATE